MTQTITVNGLRLTFPDDLTLDITTEGVTLNHKSKPVIQAITTSRETIARLDNENAHLIINEQLHQCGMPPYAVIKERMLTTLRNELGGVASSRILSMNAFTDLERRRMKTRHLTRVLASQLVKDGLIEQVDLEGRGQAVYQLVKTNNDTLHEDTTHERHE